MSPSYICHDVLRSSVSPHLLPLSTFPSRLPNKTKHFIYQELLVAPVLVILRATPNFVQPGCNVVSIPTLSKRVRLIIIQHLTTSMTVAGIVIGCG